MQIRFLVLLLLAFANAAHGERSISAQRCNGIWAASAKPPYDESSSFGPSEVVSPNGLFSIRGTDEGLSLVTGTGGKILLPDVITPPITEVLWSTDSRHFAINFSDGGAVGTWMTSLYSLGDTDYPLQMEIQSLLKKSANKLPRCYRRETANLGIAAWLNNGKEMLLIAEVPPHSSCRNMGDIFGYRISVKSGAILERFSETVLRKKWGRVLGCRFAKRQTDK